MLTLEDMDNLSVFNIASIHLSPHSFAVSDANSGCFHIKLHNIAVSTSGALYISTRPGSVVNI